MLVYKSITDIFWELGWSKALEEIPFLPSDIFSLCLSESLNPERAGEPDTFKILYFGFKSLK
jgi:hypothetical protein